MIQVSRTTLIHTYDYPGMAELRLPAARRYAKIAPAAPHALHMPSHIFARLGMWQEDIDSNLASIAASRNAAAAVDPHGLVALARALISHASGAPGRGRDLAALASACLR